MGLTSILAAIYEDDAGAVQRLLRNDPALSASFNPAPQLYWGRICHWFYAGDTPLHLAAAGYRVEIVRLLLKAGADPNASRNHRRSGPLHYAADTCLNSPAWDARKQIETLRCLVAAGADVKAQDKNGATPLHRAVRTRGAAAVKFLLSAGSDPTVRNKPGSTAFHLAVQNTGKSGSGSARAKAAQRQIIQTFLSAGISAGLKDGRGKSVRDCATSDWIRELFRD